MRRRFRWCSLLVMIGFAMMTIWWSGCGETLKGVQRDWQRWSDLDKEFQENWW